MKLFKVPVTDSTWGGLKLINERVKKQITWRYESASSGVSRDAQTPKHDIYGVDIDDLSRTTIKDIATSIDGHG